MNYNKISELLNDYDPLVKQAILRILDEEEQKISMLNPRGIKEQLRKVIEEMVSE